MKSWSLVLIGLCLGCHDDDVTTAYGKNALRRENAEPESQPDVKPVETEAYEPPLTPRQTDRKDEENVPEAEPRTIHVDRLPPWVTPPPSKNYYKAEDKMVVDKGGGRMVANQVIVKLKEKCTEEEAMKMLSSAGAKKIGQIVELRLYQLQVKAETAEALSEWVAKLGKLECVEYAVRNLETVF